MRLEACPREGSPLPLPVIFAGILLLAGALGALWVALGLPLPPCLLRQATGIPCPTCGAGRMAGSLLHGDLLGALGWNPLMFLAGAGILTAGAVSGVRKLAGAPGLRVVLTAGEKRWARIGAVLLLVSGWVYLVAAGI